MITHNVATLHNYAISLLYNHLVFSYQLKFKFEMMLYLTLYMRVNADMLLISILSNVIALLYLFILMACVQISVLCKKKTY